MSPLSPRASALVVPPRGAAVALLKALVVPTDFSPEAESVLPVALAIAERTGADLHLVHVLAPAAGSVMPWREQQAQARLASTRIHYRHSLLGRAPMQTAVLAPGEPGEALAAYVRQEGAGLVLGSLQQAAPRVVAAPYPMLLVPPGNPGTLRRLVSIGGTEALASLLGQALSVEVVTPEGDGAYDFCADALLVSPPGATGPSPSAGGTHPATGPHPAA